MDDRSVTEQLNDLKRRAYDIGRAAVRLDDFTLELKHSASEDRPWHLTVTGQPLEGDRFKECVAHLAETLPKTSVWGWSDNALLVAAEPKVPEPETAPEAQEARPEDVIVPEFIAEGSNPADALPPVPELPTPLASFDLSESEPLEPIEAPVEMEPEPEKKKRRR